MESRQVTAADVLQAISDPLVEVEMLKNQLSELGMLVAELHGKYRHLQDAQRLQERELRNQRRTITSLCMKVKEHNLAIDAQSNEIAYTQVLVAELREETPPFQRITDRLRENEQN